MSETIEIFPSSTPSSTGRAMARGFTELTKTAPLWTRLAITAIQIATSTLVFLGGTAIGLIIVVTLVGQMSLWILFIGGLLAIAGHLLLNRYIFSLAGRANDKTTLNRGARLLCSPQGVTFTNGRSEWKTVWQDVHGINVQNGVVTIATGGIVFPFLQTDISADDLARIRSWHDASRG